jgi:hypothetical protein
MQQNNFKQKIMTILSSKKFMIGISYFGLYLLVAGISMAIFSFVGVNAGNVAEAPTSSRSKIDTSLPKTEACPINGMMYTKPEKNIWEQRRPLTAVIENHQDSRPQSGLSKADVVYEAVAEGGITRFLGIFYCGVSSDNYTIGQIRSARVYFINYAAEYGTDPLFVHWGGANNICNDCPGGVKTKGQIDPRVDAYKVLEQIGWMNGQYGNDMNGAANTGYPALYTDDRRMNLAVEHQKVGSTDKIFEEAKKRGFEFKDADGVAWNKTFTPWTFIKDKPETPVATEISFEFWKNKPEYDVTWKYDQQNNRYMRFNGGKEHKDMENGEQLWAKNVAILFAKEEGPVDKEIHMFYTTEGKGKAMIFQNGIVIEGTWAKATRTSRTKFTDDKGKEIPFVAGPIWIEVLPDGNTVSY